MKEITKAEDSSKWLWCGGSVWCRCSHHIECHDESTLLQIWGRCCSFQDCKCDEFVSYRVKEPNLK